MKIIHTILSAFTVLTILFFIQTPVFAAETAATDTKTKVTTGQLVAKVVWVKGTCTASPPGSDTKRALKTASEVYMHDTLMTDAGSEAQIVFTDNSTMTLRPETKLYINEYNYKKPGKKAAEAPSTASYIMDLIAGGFRTITGAIAKENPDNYQINTPVATIGVRGTEFSVVYKPPKTYVKRYKGEPCVSQKGADKNEKGKTLCLDDKNKYASAEEGGAPQIEVDEPDVFRVDVEVVPVSFMDMNNDGSGGSSFCIQ